jgi:uncharacterized protein (TIGR00251 family)
MSRLVLELRVQPGAKRSEFAGMHGERIKVRVAAPAAEGRANEALIEFLAREFGVAKRNIAIEAGASSRSKRVAVQDPKEPMPWSKSKAPRRIG